MKNKVKLERPFLLAVCLLSSIMLNAQPTLQWQKCIGGTNDKNAPSIVETLDGYVLPLSTEPTVYSFMAIDIKAIGLLHSGTYLIG